MKRPPRQVRLDDDIEAEVKKIADATDLPQIEIIRQMIRAGVLAIKENDYDLPLPLRLKVLSKKSRMEYPEVRDEGMLAAETPKAASLPNSETSPPATAQVLDILKKKHGRPPHPK